MRACVNWAIELSGSIYDAMTGSLPWQRTPVMLDKLGLEIACCGLEKQPRSALMR